MFLLNLTLAQFLAIAGAAAAITTALYLFDRSRRRIAVATLRFWVEAGKASTPQRRKHIQQPLSLLLELLGLLLLALALAQPRWGTRDALPAQHVLLLDTSSWMAARSRSASGRTLMDDARDRAVAYVRALPAHDEVMLVRADALAAPATAFVESRTALEQAIAASRPGATALHLERAFAFAQNTQQLGGRRGAIAYIGPARVADAPEAVRAPANLRVIPVNDAPDNAGLRRIALKRNPADPELWEANVSVRNYGATARQASLAASFDGAPVGGKVLALPPASEAEAVFTWRTRAAGVLEVRLLDPDAFADDNRALLDVPSMPSMQVTVYSDAPEALRPLFSATRFVQTTFHPTAQYRAEDAAGGLIVLDRFRPAVRPAADTLWLDPPPSQSPVPVRTRLTAPAALRWSPDSVLTAGLRGSDMRVVPTVFMAAQDDEVVASVDAGPVILARPGEHKTLVMGFQPALSKLRYELATPLLFANILRWVAPESFRLSELRAQSPGTVTLPLDAGVTADSVKVHLDDGTRVPFTVQDHQVRFYAGARGKVRVQAGDREAVYTLSLPEMWETRWDAPANVPRGVPGAAAPDGGSASRDLWQWLALLGAACFLIEWVLFGRRNRRVRRAVPMPLKSWRKAS